MFQNKVLREITNNEDLHIELGLEYVDKDIYNQ